MGECPIRRLLSRRPQSPGAGDGVNHHLRGASGKVGARRGHHRAKGRAVIDPRMESHGASLIERPGGDLSAAAVERDPLFAAAVAGIDPSRQRRQISGGNPMTGGAEADVAPLRWRLRGRWGEAFVRRWAGGGRRPFQARDLAFAGDGVEAPAGVFAEGVEVGDFEALAVIAACQAGAGGGQLQRADFADAEIAVDVAAVEVAEAAVADDVAADDRAAVRGVATGVDVRVVEDGFGEAGRFALPRGQVVGRPGDEALAAVPALVRAIAADPAVRQARREVDLLARALADVADHQVAGQAVEGEAERVAQAVAPDSRAWGCSGSGRRAGSCRAGCSGSGSCGTGHCHRRRRRSRRRGSRPARTAAGRRCGCWRRGGGWSAAGAASRAAPYSPPAVSSSTWISPVGSLM